MISEVPIWSRDIYDRGNLWEKGMVPYILKNDLEDEELEVVQEAFDTISHIVPCINFR